MADETETAIRANVLASAPGAVKVLKELVDAGTKVIDDLNARIDAAPSTAKPVFYGIADLHDALHHARVALDTVLEPGWRTMDSAPKDGTRFLAILHRETAEDMDGRKWPPFSEVREIFYREWKSPIFNDSMPWHAGDPFDNDFASDHFGEDVPIAWLPLDRLPSPPKEGGAA